LRGDEVKTGIAFGSLPYPIVAGFILLGAFSSMLLGRQSAPEQPLAFDVASIKPHPMNTRIGVFDVVDRRDPPTLPSAPRRRFSDHLTTIKVLIVRAYDLKLYQVLGLPGWAGPEGASPGEYYDVDAVAPMENPTRSQLQFMLQSLLAERFQLRVHRETRELPVYVLMVAKGGAKFKANTGEPTPISLTLFSLAQSLSRHVDRPIVDRTDLTGHYDFPPSPFYRELAQDPPGSASGVSDLLRAHLGLELKPERVSMEVLVVDHVERPSAN
jgi:uncharacterized protein (TIGR03435 family)